MPILGVSVNVLRVRPKIRSRQRLSQCVQACRCTRVHSRAVRLIHRDAQKKGRKGVSSAFAKRFETLEALWHGQKNLERLHPALETPHRTSHSTISIPHSSLHPALRTTHSALDLDCLNRRASCDNPPTGPKMDGHSTSKSAHQLLPHPLRPSNWAA